ncbi:oxidative damage protection protein [Blochmannia endosymbiont of Camponotus modoc]|uniref:oxidative damage protection protein n=1 Tax=Blochmannia endosymbiont of Camponotus modoc TaxID=2945587 RepID=UPI002024BDCA|nr:oxidative damage protection protein [Blochmannia endosymbiont of Camponotus modoc]URJ26525.1 oxidative damage protection protein [Blochmannia endosymbiont of Camponotus modoc]URJ31996.1 oxidative damage protection protein [Blochmannia endosymbiont of Camponotus modoc]
MSKIIYCVFLKKYAAGLDAPCYPGALGRYIYEHISKIAWMQWQNKQTILINENKLNMMNISDRTILEKEMKIFLFGKNFSIKNN